MLVAKRVLLFLGLFLVQAPSAEAVRSAKATSEAKAKTEVNDLIFS